MSGLFSEDTLQTLRKDFRTWWVLLGEGKMKILAIALRQSRRQMRWLPKASENIPSSKMSWKKQQIPARVWNNLLGHEANLKLVSNMLDLGTGVCKDFLKVTMLGEDAIGQHSPDIALSNRSCTGKVGLKVEPQGLKGLLKPIGKGGPVTGLASQACHGWTHCALWVDQSPTVTCCGLEVHLPSCVDDAGMADSRNREKKWGMRVCTSSKMTFRDNGKHSNQKRNDPDYYFMIGTGTETTLIKSTGFMLD